MASTISTDIFEVYRGTEDQITNLNSVPIKDGNVYFAYDKDESLPKTEITASKLYFDANQHRFVVAGGGDISFIKAHPAEEPIENEDYYYEFNKSDIDAHKVNVDNILITDDNVLYRVVAISADGQTIYTQKIVGGGGGTGTENPLSITWVTDFPARLIDTRVPSATVRLNSRNANIDRGILSVYCNDVEVTELANPTQAIKKTDVTIQIPLKYLVNGTNRVDVKIDAAGYSFTANGAVTMFHAEFAPTNDWNPRRIFGTDATSVDVQKTISFPYTFTGLSDGVTDKLVSGTIQVILDGEIVKTNAQLYGNGTITINCTDEIFAGIQHGNHTLSYYAYAVVNEQMYEVTNYTYDIIWATEAGGTDPIIISPYSSDAEEENYNIINIPYLVYQKDTEESQLHLYINGEELATSPITVKYDKTAADYLYWQITKYVTDQTQQPNTFIMRVGAVQREFNVTILPSQLNLDADNSDDLLLYLSAQDRSNKESNTSRKTWKYGNYSAQFEGFNWYNNGWQLDDDGINVLRLNNGAKVTIPFDGILQETQPKPGFTIEVEFKCRNAINYSKLLSLQLQKNPETGEDDDSLPPIKEINYVPGTHDVANAVGTYFKNNLGFVFGTQEAFFRSSGKTVNVRYADNDKVKVSVVADDATKFLYIYINGVLSGVERYDDNTSFQAQADALVFNSDYCDLDLYTIRVYKKALSFDGIVQNWVGDAPDLKTKLARYEENNITRTFTVNGVPYVTLDYEKTKALSKKLAERYIAAGRPEGMQKGMPIMVITTYGQDELPYNKKNKKYVGVRFWDPNGEVPVVPADKKWDENGNEVHWYGFKARDFEFTVQGTSSQGYPRRNFKAKIKDAKDKSPYQSQYPFEFTTWDGNDVYADTWSANTTAFADAGYEKIKKIDIGNGTQETKFCFKADFMDSSSSHNTPLANYIQTLYSNSGSYDLRHPLSLLGANTNGVTYRTTVYGFPMLVFHERKGSTEPIEFVGRYNFNTDKSATDSFGFTIEIPHKILGNTLMTLPTGEEDDAGKIVLDENYRPMSEERYPTYKDICECWELTSNQHGFTGFRRNDFGTVIQGEKSGHPELDFYNFWECRYSIWDFGDPAADDDVYSDDPDANKTNAIANLRYYMRNIEALSAWIYSTDVHPWDTDDETNVNHHKLTQMTNAKTMHYTVDNEGNVTLLRDYYLMPTSTTVSKIPAEWFSATWDDEEHTSHTLIVHNPEAAEGVNIPLNTIYEDEINAVLATPITYLTRDTEWDANILTQEEVDALDASARAGLRKDGDLYIKVNKTYYLSNNSDSGIPVDWYHIIEDKIDTQKVDENNNPVYVKEYDIDGVTVKTETINVNEALTKTIQMTDSNNVKLWVYEYVDENGETVQGTTTDINQAIVVDGKAVPATYEEPIAVMTQVVQSRKIVVIRPQENETLAAEVAIANVYELFTRDTKNYRLSKFRAEFKDHLNVDYCAAYFVLTELMILYDSREKNMMIATWGPEKEGGDYIWYPIFYDMDTQLGVNNSGTVYWDYDVNAQDDGIFSGAGSVLWDNFYACFLPEIKMQYINWRNNTLTYANCIKFYNTNSADTWTPIMKNTDAFYKYIAPAITGLGYIDQNGDSGQMTDAYFYCAQGDRSLNRAAFFRNRFNYKDSEWLGGTYRTQGGANIEMRYDANWTGTSDPDASTWASDAEAQAARRNAGLDATAHFDITPYLTQYTSVYYDELPRSGGRYDIQNPPANGYVRVTPLESIQQTIDNGLPLSQQLVYIYGPAYLRDIGDLSTKYLDRLTLAAAVRLNRLILGNDNPLYRNDGATSESIKIESPYRDASGVLNPNAKSLLEYLDLSNLANMRGSLDMTGCLKLKTVRALGSSLTAISLPEGNVVSTLYLPSTNEDFVLIQGQKLSTIIRDRDNCITSTAPNNVPVEGLYLENITDKMDVSANNNVITEYMTNAIGGITIPNNFVKNNIKKYQLESGVLGFQSYEILDYIVKSKIIMNVNPSAGDKLTVMMRLLNVDWSPYHLLDETENRVTGVVYYIRNTDNTYSVLDTNTTFDYARKNLGGVYSYNENMTLRYNANTVKHGIPDLNLLQLFINDYDNGAKTNLNGKYLFRDTFESNNQKFLPHIGGEIYVDNDETINEYDLYTIQERYNSVLGVNDTKMTICAKNVTPCPRARFIEVIDGVQYERGLYRSNNANNKVFAAEKDIIENCVRTHYDFRGWVSKTDAMAYDNTFIDDNGVPLSDSIVLKDSAILDHLVDLSTLVFGTTAEAYYAVYTLHEYNVTYVLDAAGYEASPDELAYKEIKLVPSGNTLSSNPCSIIPWKTSSSQSLFMMWVFKGWAYKNETSPRDLSKIRAQSDVVLYPVFEEDSVYNNPVADEDIDYVISTTGQAYIRGFRKHLGGKVTIPKYVEGTYPVVSIVGTQVNNGNVEKRWSTYMTPIPNSNESTLPTSNGIQDNNDITHLFFEGANDNTSTIRSLGQYSCYNAQYLVYLDMPPSLVTFEQYCCHLCKRLSFASISYATTIGGNAFGQCNLPETETNPVVANETLSITANDGLKMSSRYHFNGSGWKYITIGSQSKPWSETDLPARLAVRDVYAINGQLVANPEGGINKVTVYSSAIPDAEVYFSSHPDALLPPPVDTNFDRVIIYVG